VRLHGASGEAKMAELRFSEPEPKSIWLSDTSERPLKPLNGKVEVPGFALVTLRVERP